MTYTAGSDNFDRNALRETWRRDLLAVVPLDGLCRLALPPLLPLPVVAPYVVQCRKDHQTEEARRHDEYYLKQSSNVIRALVELETIDRDKSEIVLSFHAILFPNELGGMKF